MRTRDEVLRAFGTAQCVKGDNCTDFDCVALNRMADRIRELEAQRSDEGLRTIGEKNAQFFTRSDEAASEPVAWALCDKHGTVVLADTATDYIGKALLEFNRDYPDDSPHTLRPLVFGDVAHPSAAAVRVTDAMVRTAFVRLYPGCEPDEMQHYHAADIRAALTAALAGPTTPTRGRDE